MMGTENIQYFLTCNVTVQIWDCFYFHPWPSV